MRKVSMHSNKGKFQENELTENAAKTVATGFPVVPADWRISLFTHKRSEILQITISIFVKGN
jgi:hypothetical protein